MDANKKKNADNDTIKTEIIDAIRRIQKGKGTDLWCTLSQITDEVGRGHWTVKQAVIQMSSEGWFHIRHNVENDERIFYRLKSEYLK